MRYAYSNSNQLNLVKNNVLMIDEWTYDATPGLLRKYQGKEEVNVIIDNELDALVLLDYLSTDRRSWDFEPKLIVNMFGTEIKFQRRGNYGHIEHLENDDVVIVDDYLRQIIKNHNNGTNKEIDELKKEIDRLKTQLSHYVYPDLPF